MVRASQRNRSLFEIVLHPRKNRLALTLEGRLDAAEARAFCEQALAAARKLRPGFVTVMVIAGLEPFPAEALDALEQFVQGCVEHGERQAIRVVGRSTQAAVQFERAGRTAGQSAHLAFSRAEADRLLDGDLPPPPGRG